jgi:hypothetical protein
MRLKKRDFKNNIVSFFTGLNLFFTNVWQINAKSFMRQSLMMLYQKLKLKHAHMSSFFYKKLSQNQKKKKKKNCIEICVEIFFEFFFCQLIGKIKNLLENQGSCEL